MLFNLYLNLNKFLTIQTNIQIAHYSKLFLEKFSLNHLIYIFRQLFLIIAYKTTLFVLNIIGSNLMLF
mgnify:CR=1 FL=1